MPPILHELGLDRLSVDDRIALAQALWDSVAEEVERAPLSEAQGKELERRLADSIARPDAVTPWEEIKARKLATITLADLLRGVTNDNLPGEWDTGPALGREV